MSEFERQIVRQVAARARARRQAKIMILTLGAILVALLISVC